MGGLLMKKEPIFKWHEKLLMYFVALVVIAFIIIMQDVKAEREKSEKIQECVQFLEDNQIE
jgi:hypothetical protein